MKLKLKKLYLYIIFFISILLLIPFIRGDYIDDGFVNSTIPNITMIIDHRIDFTNIIDNTSGIFIEQIIIDRNLSCGNQSFYTPNTILNTSGFPYTHWNCYPWTPPEELVYNNAMLSLNAAMMLLILGALLLPIAALFLILYGSKDYTTLLIATAASIDLFILVILFYYIKSIFVTIM